MNEREFYRVILGLTDPWEVQEVKVDVSGRKVEVRVGCRVGTLWACPQSRERLPVHDHVERSWRHLDPCQFETLRHCRVPRLRLADGSVWAMAAPWAEARRRFTALFEQRAVTVLLAARTLRQAAQWLRLDWDAVPRIMERAVARGRDRRRLDAVRHVGLDEQSFRRLARPPASAIPLRHLGGQDDISVLVDIDAAAPRVLEVAEGREQIDAEMLL